MAKLSFDYAKLTAHPRFKALAKKLGPSGNALDCVCRFWSVAQEYWGDGRRCVPDKIFDLDEEFAHLITTDFARRQEGGVYATGAEEFFEWYATKREAARKGGLASVKVRKEKGGSAQPHIPEADPKQCFEADPKQTRSIFEAPPKHTEALGSNLPNPSISVSTSSSVSTSVSISEPVPESHGDIGCTALTLAHYEEPEAKAAKKPKSTEGGEVWEAYRSAYLTRYGVEPVRNAMTNANCSQLVKRLGADDAQAVVRFYLTHGKAYYTSVAHSLKACVFDAEALVTQMRTGQRITQTQARQADQGQANTDVFAETMRRWEQQDAAKAALKGGPEA